jgi:hypothetical protein
MVSCGTCGQTFATKGEKRRHKLGCGGMFDSGQGAPVDDAGRFGRPLDHITPEIKARADAEWAAMDDRGQLPEGWEYRP